MYERLYITRYKCCKNAKFSYFYSYLLNSEFLLNQGACFYRILNWTLVYMIMHIAKMYFCQYLFLSKSLLGSWFLFSPALGFGSLKKKAWPGSRFINFFYQLRLRFPLTGAGFLTSGSLEPFLGIWTSSGFCYGFLQSFLTAPAPSKKARVRLPNTNQNKIYISCYLHYYFLLNI